MIKYAKYAVPYLMKAPRRNPVKNLAGFALAYILIILSAFFILTASFIWLTKEYGAEVAFAVTGGTLLFSAITLLAILRRPRKAAAPIPPKLADDPLAKYIPENVRENPTMQKLLYQIGESPVTATATAVTLGMLISREFLEET